MNERMLLVREPLEMREDVRDLQASASYLTVVVTCCSQAESLWACLRAFVSNRNVCGNCSIRM
jgi:hypothetical protein